MPRSGGLYYAAQTGHRDSMPVLLLIHGAGGSTASWPYQLRRLPGWRVIAPDLPGHGSSSLASMETLAAYADCLWQWLADLGIEQAVLAGHSMGAAIALLMAQRAARRTQGLVLLGGAARFSVNPHLMETLLHPGRGNEGVRNIVQWSFARQSHAALRSAYTRQLLANRAGQLYADFVACSHFDFGEAAPGLRVPALVLSGAEDQMVAPHLSQALAQRLPLARYQAVPGAGHMLMLERPVEVAACVEDALRNWESR